MKKKYRVSKGLEPFVRRILLRSFYICNMEYDNNTDTIWCYTNCPPDAFHKVIQRAKCEKKERETGLLYLTKAEAANMLIADELMRLHNTTCFTVIDSDGDDLPDWM